MCATVQIWFGVFLFRDSFPAQPHSLRAGSIKLALFRVAALSAAGGARRAPWSPVCLTQGVSSSWLWMLKPPPFYLTPRSGTSLQYKSQPEKHLLISVCRKTLRSGALLQRTQYPSARPAFGTAGSRLSLARIPSSPRGADGQGS